MNHARRIPRGRAHCCALAGEARESSAIGTREERIVEAASGGGISARDREPRAAGRHLAIDEIREPREPRDVRRDVSGFAIARLAGERA